MDQYYWCQNCFNVFDEPGFTREWVADEFGEHCELWSCCPRCESTDFEPAEQCEGLRRLVRPKRNQRRRSVRKLHL